MTKTEIKQLVKDEIYANISNYEIDETMIEDLNDKELEYFYQEHDKYISKFLKLVE